MLRAAEADRIAFIANAGQIGPGTPYRPAPNAFQSLDAQSIIYDQNDASGFIAERLRETVRSKPSSYFPLAGPVRIAMVDPAGKVVSAATRGIRDIRRLAPGEYLLSLNTPISNPNTQVKVFPDGIYSNRASHHISDPNTVRVRLTGQNGDLVDGGFAVLITSSGR